MNDETGARLQEALRVHPFTSSLQSFPFPLIGTITDVLFCDSSQNKGKQTFVDIVYHGGYGSSSRVPVSSVKSNLVAGEEWTPEIGDSVIVQFIAGKWAFPIVTGYVNVEDNWLQASTKDIDDPKLKRRYHFRCNKTDIVVDSDGNRKTYIAKDDTCDVKDNAELNIYTGDYTINVNKGNLKINVNKGDAVISIEGDTKIRTMGDTTIQTMGDTKINSSGDTDINTTGTMTATSTGACNITSLDSVSIQAMASVDVTSGASVSITSMGVCNIQGKATIDIDGGSGISSGVVTNLCVCPFTGNPHSDFSIDVTATRGL